MSRSLLDKYYKISEVFDDDAISVSLALKACGSKEPVNYLYERLIKVNLEKSEEHLTILHSLILNPLTHEGLRELIKICKTTYMSKDSNRSTYTKDGFVE